MIKLKYGVTKRGIQIALGVLWFIDGLLQLQPQMFTANFATNVIAPAAQGQPSFVSVPMQFFIHVFLLQPAVFGALIAAIQLALGVLILWRRTADIGLWCSVAWGLFVWYIGEGLGGLAGGHTLLLMGAPGAALIYALLALGTVNTGNAPKQPSKRPAYWLTIAWAILWTAGTIYQFLPGQNTIINVTAMVSANASGAPGWLASLDNSVATHLAGIGNAAPPTAMTGMSMSSGESIDAISMTPAQAAAGLWFMVLLAVLQIAIGFAIFIPGLARYIAVLLGCSLAAVYWIVGQSLGSYFSGLATDPSTGPLFILLGVAVLGCTQHDGTIRRYLVATRTALGS
jgi:hypothetical protein